MIIARAALVVAVFLAAVHPGAAIERQLVLQQGLDGYAGVEDTFVSAQDWSMPPQHTLNAGLSADLMVTRDGGESALLRFDLSAIPANSQIISATLDLTNLTESSWSGSQQFVRRIELFAVSTGWHEGNQDRAAIDSPGDFGSTGDNALSFFTGEGVDQPWGQRGLEPGADFDAIRVSYADVVDTGWYSWSVTEPVRAWVRSERPNRGLVLRDATGYEDGNVDWRAFVSSQDTGAPGSRPRLTVVYNPDTPSAHAGLDQEILDWAGEAVVLDGTGSSDRPGGDDATLRYSWTIVDAALGSSLTGGVGSDALTSFTPDVAGEWVIELEVTNDLLERATDSVRVRVLSIPVDHPRIYLTPGRLSALRARAQAGARRWLDLEAEAIQSDSSMVAKALVSQVGQQASFCREAVGQALAEAANPVDWPTKAGDIALVYDWCHDHLSGADDAVLLAYFEAWAADVPKSEDISGWGNYWPRYSYSWGLAGLAAHGHHGDAQSWFDRFRHERFAALDLPVLDRISSGGGWPEGMIYDWIANTSRVKSLEAWRTATGEDLFQSSPWFEERLGYLLLHRWPGTADEWGHVYHPYVSTGDTERERGAIGNYERIMALILISRFPSNHLASQLQAYLSAGPTGGSGSFLFHDEFLWFDPTMTRSEPTVNTHLASATGMLLARSDWPSGAADTNPDATYLTFQCGDHFSYHQHFDQNSFTLYRGGDLIVDSGVYSGEGLSNHDVNYYVRTIAHNTLVVFNPDEDLSAARPDATSNDGGQRTTAPASRSPWDIDYFDRHAIHYETGDLDRFATEERFTWARGDATAAYNNPTYNQAMDTAASGNVAKVDRFQRELVYLRRGTLGRSEQVVLYDRVSVVDSRFSGAATKLLFHTLGEPLVSGSRTVVGPGETLYAGAATARASTGSSDIHFSFLLPAAHNVRKVGGRGEKAFWVFDGNYDWHWDPGEEQPRPVNDFETVPYGEWRLELEPADTALAHRFLTVLEPTPAGLVPMAVEAVVGDGVEGVHVDDPGLARVALFSTAADGSAPSGTVRYDYPVGGATLNLLFDLAPGARFQLAAGSVPGRRAVVLTPSDTGALEASGAGVLVFTLDDPLLFRDGFESGNTTRWSTATP